MYTRYTCDAAVSKATINARTRYADRHGYYWHPIRTRHRRIHRYHPKKRFSQFTFLATPLSTARYPCQSLAEGLENLTVETSNGSGRVIAAKFYLFSLKGGSGRVSLSGDQIKVFLAVFM